MNDTRSVFCSEGAKHVKTDVPLFLFKSKCWFMTHRNIQLGCPAVELIRAN